MLLKVVAGVAYHTGRFNVASEIKIFEEPLYKKNVIPAEPATPQLEETTEKEEPVAPLLKASCLSL